MPTRIIDLSFPLEPATPVYPDDEPFRVSLLETTEEPPSRGRRSLNSSRIAVGLHCGTHMDAPFHFIPGAPTIDQIPLEQCAGPALLIRLPQHAHGGVIGAGALERHRDLLRQLRKVVLDTGWRENWGHAGYFSEHPLISGEAAKFLVGCGVHLVGVDMPSVDRPPFEAHLEFLGNHVVIVENLVNLEQIQADVFRLIALPLKLKALEASPVRAIAMEID
jgi:arylformamidase